MVKRPVLTREKIIAKALAMADKDGINALSMRKLAAELKVQAMSLYYHFKSKEELVAQMADALVTEIDMGDAAELERSDWRTLMLNRAISAKALFSRHVWLPFVLDAQVQSGRKRLEYLDKYIATLRKTGLPIELALRITSLLDSYVYGYCLQLTHVSDSSKSQEKLAEEFSAGFNPSDFPYLSEAVSLVMEHGYDAEADFLFGLNIILNGVNLELAE